MLDQPSDSSDAAESPLHGADAPSAESMPASPDLAGPDSPHFQLPSGADVEKEAGWEEVAEGRFMPRRVRGSCHGRALG